MSLWDCLNGECEDENTTQGGKNTPRGRKISFHGSENTKCGSENTARGSKSTTCEDKNTPHGRRHIPSERKNLIEKVRILNWVASFLIDKGRFQN